MNRFHQKHITAKAAASLLLQVCRRYAVYPEELHGSLQRNILFLRLHPQEDRMKFFLRKQEILVACREMLATLGSGVIVRDMRVTAKC